MRVAPPAPGNVNDVSVHNSCAGTGNDSPPESRGFTLRVKSSPPPHILEEMPWKDSAASPNCEMEKTAAASAVALSKRDTTLFGLAAQATESSSFGEGAPGSTTRSDADPYGGGGCCCGMTAKAPSNAVGTANDNTRRKGVTANPPVEAGGSGGRGSNANKQPAGDAPHESGAGDGEGDGDCVPVEDPVGEGDSVNVDDAVDKALQDAVDDTAAMEVTEGIPVREGVRELVEVKPAVGVQKEAPLLELVPTGQRIGCMDDNGQKEPAGHMTGTPGAQ